MKHHPWAETSHRERVGLRSELSPEPPNGHHWVIPAHPLPNSRMARAHGTEARWPLGRNGVCSAPGPGHYTRSGALHPLRGATPDQKGCNAYGSGAVTLDTSITASGSSPSTPAGRPRRCRRLFATRVSSVFESTGFKQRSGDVVSDEVRKSWSGATQVFEGVR